MEHTALQQLPGYIWALNFIAQAVVPLTLVTGAWFAVARSDLTAPQRYKTAGVISAIIAVWFGVAWWFSQANAFFVEADQIPRIQYALVIPIIAGLALMLGTRRGVSVVSAVPQPFLIGAQIYRAFGVMFLVLWSLGQLPGEFAIPAGVGDVIVGISAPFVAWLNARGSASAERATQAWNMFGIADLVIAVTMGFLTSPSPLQLLAFDQPNLLITQYPLVIVPAFLVPASIILHSLSLWKLAYQSRHSTLHGQAAAR